MVPCFYVCLNKIGPQPTERCSENCESNQVAFSNLLLSTFGEPERIVVAGCFSCLTGVTPGPEPAFRDSVVYNLVVTSFYWSHCCLWVMWNPITRDLWHQQGNLALRTRTFLCSGPFPINPSLLCMKIPRQHFVKYSDQTTVLFNSKSVKLPNEMLGLNFCT